MTEHLANATFSGPNYAAQFNQVNGDVEINESNDKRKNFIRWLSPLNFAQKQADVTEDHQPGTGEWFIQSQPFKDWRDGKNNVLWCHGIPGSGKTVLTQLAENEDELTVEAEHLLQKHTKSSLRPSLDDVVSALGAEIARRPATMILVDAIDECPAPVQRKVIEHLKRLLQDSRVRIMVTSRFDQTLLPGASMLEIRARDEDTAKFVRERIEAGISPVSETLSSSLREESTLREEIISGVVGKTNGMFLVARLSMDHFEGATSLKDLRTALHDLPSELDEFYHNAWSRINEQKSGHRQLAHQIVRWISSAFSQMTMEQLRHALAVQEDDTKLDGESLPMVDVMLPTCQGLVKADHDSQLIRFVHGTTHEFFETLRSQQFPDAHVSIGRTCLTYLNFDVFAQGPCQFNSFSPTDLGGARGRILEKDILTRRISRNPLVIYAAHHWADHVRGETEKELEAQILNFLAKSPNLASSVQVQFAGTEYQYDPELKATGSLGLHVAVCSHLRHIIDVLLPDLSTAEICGVDQRGKSALHWAVEAGNVPAALQLLRAGADLNTPIRWESNAKQKMMMGVGSGEVSEITMRMGNEIADEVRVKGNLVYRSVEMDLVEVLEAHVRATEDLVLEKERAQDVLWKASSLGKVASITSALEWGADIEARDAQFQTPLMVAIGELHGDATELLLSRGASTSPNSGSENGREPLQRAVECQQIFEDRLDLIRKHTRWAEEIHSQRHKSIVSVNQPFWARLCALLNPIFDEDIKPPWSRYLLFQEFLTALREDSSHVQIIQHLVKYGADITVQTEDAETLFHLAVCCTPRLEALIAHSGARTLIGKTAKGRKTALHYAAAAGNPEAMRVLLSHGADINAKDSEGATALHYSVWTAACIRLAFEKNAKADSTDSAGRTPFHYLAMLGEDPDPDDLNAWQEEQLAGQTQEQRYSQGHRLEYYTGLPRRCDGECVNLLARAYTSYAEFFHGKDMYNMAVWDYIYQSRKGQRGFEHIHQWLKHMRDGHKVRLEAAEEAIDEARRNPENQREVFTMDINELFGEQHPWTLVFDDGTEQVIDPGERPKRMMHFSGKRPEEFGSGDFLIVPT